MEAAPLIINSNINSIIWLIVIRYCSSTLRIVPLLQGNNNRCISIILYPPRIIHRVCTKGREKIRLTPKNLMITNQRSGKEITGLKREEEERGHQTMCKVTIWWCCGLLQTHLDPHIRQGAGVVWWTATLQELKLEQLILRVEALI